MTILEPARALRHPLWWTSLLVLAANDHLLKGAGLLPGWLTGKLSDVSGLVVAPALVATLLGVRSRGALTACHFVAAAALAALKVVPGVAEAVVALAAAVGETWTIVADPTDLLALPAALLSFRILEPVMRARPSAAVRRGLGPRELLLAALGALACGATSRSAPQAPTIHAGEVLAQAWPDGALQRFDGRTGRVAPSVEGTADTHLDAPVVQDGAVWFADADGIHAVDLRTGAERWRHAERDVGFGTIAGVDETSVYVLVPCFTSGCEEARWLAVDRTARRTRWSMRGQAGAPPAFGDGSVALAEGPRLVVRDAGTSSVRWTRTFSADAQAVAIDAGLVWVVEPEPGTLHALRVGDGAEQAKFALGTPVSPQPRGWYHFATSAAADGRVFLAVGRDIVAFDASHPGPLWRVPGSSVGASGGIAVVDHGGDFAAVDARTGRVQWQMEAGWGGAVVGDGLLAFRNGDDVVDVVDLVSGRRLVHFDLEEGRAVPFTP